MNSNCISLTFVFIYIVKKNVYITYSYHNNSLVSRINLTTIPISNLCSDTKVCVFEIKLKSGKKLFMCDLLQDKDLEL